MSEFKDMLKYLREREKLSQKELADKLGISASTISMYEIGSRQPNFEMEETIADFFNVDLNTLRGKQTFAHAEEWDSFIDDVAKGKINHEEIQHAIEMYHKYRKSSPKVQSMVEYLLEEGNSTKASQQD